MPLAEEGSDFSFVDFKACLGLCRSPANKRRFNRGQVKIAPTDPIINQLSVENLAGAGSLALQGSLAGPIGHSPITTE